MAVILSAGLLVSCGPTDKQQVSPSSSGQEAPAEAEAQGTAPSEADARQTALAEAVAKPDATPADPLAIPVPDGSAEELIQFISDVAQRTPRGKTDEERNQDIARQMEARIVACDRLMEKEGGIHRLLAQQTKLESLRVLVAVGAEGAPQRFEQYVNQLVNSPGEEFQRLGRIGAYQLKLDALIAQGPQGPVSPEEAVAALAELLQQEELDLMLLQAANETGLLLSQVGLAENSVEVFTMISDAFGGHEDPQLAKAAKTAAEQAKMITLGLQLRTFARGDGSQGLDELRTTIQEITPSAQLAGNLLSIAQNLEYGGRVEAAKSLYDMAAQMTSQLEGERSEQLKDMLAQAQTRIGLIGSEFTLTGVKSDGTPFVWGDYAGKVVLVDFWASWCRPCIAEIPNVMENYERFHDAGFEVVGVNLDDEPDAAREFLEQRELPWTTIISEDDAARGFQDPNCEKYGVSAIPFLVLVGKDGKVDSLHLRGPQLGNRLAQLLPTDDATAANEEAGDVEVATAGPDDGDTDPQPEAPAEDTMDLLDDATETLPPDAAGAAIRDELAPDDLPADAFVIAHGTHAKSGSCSP